MRLCFNSFKYFYIEQDLRGIKRERGKKKGILILRLNINVEHYIFI